MMILPPHPGILRSKDRQEFEILKDMTPSTSSPGSWEDIVRQNSARVYRLAFRLTGNQHDAEDLTQDVFVRVFRSLSTFQPGTFEGWLHRITTNLFLDQVRRRARVRIDAMGDNEQLVPGSREDQPDRGFEHGNLDHDIQRALDALPPEYRAAVVLCDIEGLSYAEIAVSLDIKMGTVRSRIHRARAQLRESLAHRRAGHDAPAVPGPALTVNGANRAPGLPARAVENGRGG